MSLTGKSVRVGRYHRTLGEQLGKGTEGKIYRIKGDESSAAKIFDKEIRADKEPKINAMLRDDNRPDDPTDKFPSIVWPERVITDSDEFLGYQMPRLDDKWDPAWIYAKELSDKSLFQRLRPAFNLACMIYEIHEQGHGVGDFNHQNIFIKDGYVSLIDCDGFHIQTENKVFPGDTFDPRYSPPEKRPDNIADVRQADRFCLAVHIFQILMGGEHPYRATGPEAKGGDWEKMIIENEFPYADSKSDYDPPSDEARSRYDAIPERIKDLFEECFSRGSKDLGWGRVSAKTWGHVLGNTDILDLPPEKLPGGSGRNCNNTNGNDATTEGGSDLESKAEDIIDSWGFSKQQKNKTSSGTSDSRDTSDKAENVKDKWDK